MTWQDDQKWESEWWGNCVNTFNEEYKQLAYARLIGLQPKATPWRDPVYDMGGKNILDIGGGPVSILLKCENFGRAIVVDPCKYPRWVYERYNAAGIDIYGISGEEILEQRFTITGENDYVFDEVWVYNVLQHVQDPELIIANARQMAKTIRIFEWVDTYIAPGHPHVLTEEKLNKWLNGKGTVEKINRNNCNGKCYYGIFNYG